MYGASTALQGVELVEATSGHPLSQFTVPLHPYQPLDLVEVAGSRLYVKQVSRLGWSKGM